jgi:hypothetical protein
MILWIESAGNHSSAYIPDVPAGCPISRVFCEKWEPVNVSGRRHGTVSAKKRFVASGRVPRLPTPGKHGAP